MQEEFKEIYDIDRKRRVLIYRGDTGAFHYEEEYFSEHPYEMCWIPAGRRVAGFYDSPQKAEIEARGNIDWLKNIEQQTN